jgi:predicted oxidoreductase
MDFFLKEKLKPMAWSPLAGGRIIVPNEEKEQRIFDSLTEVANELDVDRVDKIIYSWLLKHPTSIIPIIGSGKIERIKYAIEALNIKMSTEQWLKIYIASAGKPLP